METRFDSLKGAKWAKINNLPITMGGLGSIGSWTILPLSRLANHRFFNYEFDKVEKRNLGGQYFSKNDINLYKAEALQNKLIDFSGYTEYHQFGKLKKGSIVTPICFAGFDNPKARKLMFEEWKKLDNRQIFIDGRMDFETFQILTVLPGHEEWYQEDIDKLCEANLPSASCTLSSTTHIAMLIGGFMTSNFVNYLMNTVYEEERQVFKSLSFNQSLLIPEIEYYEDID